MKLFSFIEEGEQLNPVEIEISIWPGLPDIHFIGRADPHLKESAKRIKSAVKAAGFEFPLSQQILVNLRPSYLKKSSRGLDLAVALGFLMASEQIPKVLSDEKLFFYGELSLEGEVFAPEGIGKMIETPDIKLVTGDTQEKIYCQHLKLLKLQGFKALDFAAADELQINWEPDSEILKLKISKAEARLVSAIAFGGHSALLAGPSGSGKTTLGKILHALMPPPLSRSEQLKILRRVPAKPNAALGIESQGLAGPSFDGDVSAPETLWRPFVRPHHTIPTHSLIGGGNQVHGGEIARADLGMLLLDEFFEFSPGTLEALREPLEEKVLRVARGGRIKVYDLNMQAIATTNLCPCGDYVPEKGVPNSCRYTLSRCKSYSQKITGPLLDRFEFLVFTPVVGASAILAKDKAVVDNSLKDPISVDEVRYNLDRLRSSLSTALLRPNLEEILKKMDPLLRQIEFEQRLGSRRRKEALIRAAHSFSVLDESSEIAPKHFLEAQSFTLDNFEKLKKWDI